MAPKKKTPAKKAGKAKRAAAPKRSAAKAKPAAAARRSAAPARAGEGDVGYSDVLHAVRNSLYARLIR